MLIIFTVGGRIFLWSASEVGALVPELLHQSVSLPWLLPGRAFLLGAVQWPGTPSVPLTTRSLQGAVVFPG